MHKFCRGEIRFVRTFSHELHARECLLTTVKLYYSLTAVKRMTRAHFRPYFTKENTDKSRKLHLNRKT